MAAATPLPVSAPAREVWRLGLENTARQTQNFFDSGPIAERLAVQYAPGFPAAGSGTRSWNPCTSSGPNITWPASTADLLTMYGFGINFYHSCPTIGADIAGAVSEGRAQLAAHSSRLTEEVLWTGLLDNGTSIETMAAAESTPGDNVRLASSAATLIDGSTAHDLTVAFGLINEWVADTMELPYKVWIHASPRILPFDAFYGQGNRTDNRKLEQMLGDHYLVLGAGYDRGSAELSVSDGEAWMIVTNPVRVAYGEITPGDGANAAQFVNRSTNRVNVAASRGVLAEWDTTVHGAIKVCLPAPGPDCP